MPLRCESIKHVCCALDVTPRVLAGSFLLRALTCCSKTPPRMFGSSLHYMSKLAQIMLRILNLFPLQERARTDLLPRDTDENVWERTSSCTTLAMQGAPRQHTASQQTHLFKFMNSCPLILCDSCRRGHAPTCCLVMQSKMYGSAPAAAPHMICHNTLKPQPFTRLSTLAGACACRPAAT